MKKEVDDEYYYEVSIGRIIGGIVAIAAGVFLFALFFRSCNQPVPDNLNKPFLLFFSFGEILWLLSPLAGAGLIFVGVMLIASSYERRKKPEKPSYSHLTTYYHFPEGPAYLYNGHLEGRGIYVIAEEDIERTSESTRVIMTKTRELFTGWPMTISKKYIDMNTIEWRYCFSAYPSLQFVVERPENKQKEVVLEKAEFSDAIQPLYSHKEGYKQRVLEYIEREKQLVEEKQRLKQRIEDEKRNAAYGAYEAEVEKQKKSEEWLDKNVLQKTPSKDE